MNRFYILCTLFFFSALTNLTAQANNIIAEIHDPSGRVYRGLFKSAGDDNGHTFYDYIPIYGMGLFWDGTDWTISLDDYPNVYFQANTHTDTSVPPSLAEGKWKSFKTGWKLVAFSEEKAPFKISLREFTPVSCNGETDASLQAGAVGGTGNYSYTWSDGTTTASTTAQLSVLEGLAPGTYSVTITDGENTLNEQIEVGEPDVLTASLLSQSNPSCYGRSTGTASVGANGGTAGYTYAWSNGATTAEVTGLAAGAYTVTVTDARGCTATVPMTLTEPSGLTLSLMVDANVSCFAGSDGAATAAVRGGTAPYSFLWSDGTTGAILVGAPAGEYEVTVTDAGGCSLTSRYSITEPEELKAAAELDKMVSCYGGTDGSATATPSGGTAPYTFAWSNGATTAGLTDLSAGEYTVTITDANGCTATDLTTITEPQPFVATADATAQAGCYGTAGGIATAGLTGGTAPFTYLWSNGATTADITDLTSGEYVLTVTDAGGCTAMTTVTITENQALRVSPAATGDSGLGDGTLTALVSGGISPYTYSWDTDPVQTTATATELAAGDYSVTVTDAAGCTTDTSLTVRLNLAGDDCGNALYVDTLFGGAMGEVYTSRPTDNGSYLGAVAGTGDWGDCLSEGDSLYHPVYYRFTGDGNTYHLRTAAGTSTVPLANGDTRGVLFAGACDDMTFVACNDDESDEAANLWMEVSTQEGMEYTLMVDGASAVSGEFALEVTRAASTSVRTQRIATTAVYPNPTSGRVSLSGLNARTVGVFDGLGRQVATYVDPGTEVNISALPAGVYQLRITDTDSNQFSARVVKR